MSEYFMISSYELRCAILLDNVQILITFVHLGEVNISVLAGWFCFLNFLAATQDIAVDG